MISETNIDFYLAVEKIVKEYKVSHLDACVIYAENAGIEMEQLGPAISKHPKLKAAIQEEAEELHLMERTSRLPV